MPWHKFVKGESYNRDYVVAECVKYINAGALKSPTKARAQVEKIRNCPHETLVWCPFLDAI